MTRSSAAPRLLLIAYPREAGVARHVVDLATRLESQWRITVACLPGSEIWEALRERPAVELQALRGTHGQPRLRDLRDLPALVRLVRHADAIHAHSSKAGFLVRLAAAIGRRRARTVFTPHAWSFFAADGARSRLYVALERLAAHWCHTIVAVSEAEREAGLEQRIGCRDLYRVVVNGIDVHLFARDPEPAPRRIVMIGRLDPQKRPDIAVRALAALRRAHADASLWIAGDGSSRVELDALVADLDLSGSVRFLGARTDVPALLAEAACFVLTSDYEGCPLSVLEAMAAGVPVVATAVGGVPELVVDGETGVLVRPRAPDEVAEAVGKLFANPASARTMGAAGRARARERFTLERMVDSLDELYREVSRPAR
jgi:glycosyltransferase involved in cell wall biosynthesis